MSLSYPTGVRPVARHRFLARPAPCLRAFDVVQMVTMLGWAIILIAPGNALTRSTSFDLFRTILSEQAWAYVFLGLGLLRGVSCLYSFRWARWVVDLIHVGFWLFVGWTFFQANHQSLGAVFCVAHALGAAYQHLEEASEHRTGA